MDTLLNRYQRQALETAVYPGIGGPLGVVYCTLKLSGEAGEVMEKILQTDFAIDRDAVTEIAKELGDVMWYVAALSAELGEAIPYAGQQRDKYWSHIITSASQISELVGKALRDDGFAGIHAPGTLREGDSPTSEGVSAKLTESRRAAILERLGMITSTVENIARGLGLTLQEVCDMNIEKLASRARRGVLAGSGDNR